MNPKKHISQSAITLHIHNGLASSQIAILHNMSAVTVKRIVKEDYPNRYAQLIENGREKQKIHCRNVRRKK